MGKGRDGTGHGMGWGENGKEEGEGKEKREGEGREGLQPPNFNSWRRHCRHRTTAKTAPTHSVARVKMRNQVAAVKEVTTKYYSLVTLFTSSIIRDYRIIRCYVLPEPYAANQSMPCRPTHKLFTPLCLIHADVKARSDAAGRGFC